MFKTIPTMMTKPARTCTMKWLWERQQNRRNTLKGMNICMKFTSTEGGTKFAGQKKQNACIKSNTLEYKMRWNCITR